MNTRSVAQKTYRELQQKERTTYLIVIEDKNLGVWMVAGELWTQVLCNKLELGREWKPHALLGMQRGRHTSSRHAGYQVIRKAARPDTTSYVRVLV
jgi:hypothetical protein